MCNKLFNIRFHHIQHIGKEFTSGNEFTLPFGLKFKSSFLETIFCGVSISNYTLSFFIFRIQTVHEFLIPISPPVSSVSHISVISTIIVCIVCNLLFRSNIFDSFAKVDPLPADFMTNIW